MRLCRLAFASLLLISQLSLEARQRIDFDFDWQFSRTDNPEYSSRPFETGTSMEVQLPHDWNIAEEFEEKWGGSAAYLPEGIGWYQKTFKTPQEAKGKHSEVVFDGIFMQSDVYINGHHLGFRPYGFCSIVYDLTPFLRPAGEDNTIAVRVNTTGGRPRWYAGAGIYRHVKLEIAEPVHVDTYGTYVTTPEVSKEKATVNVSTSVVNSGAKTRKAEVTQKIKDAEGKIVAESGKLSLSLQPDSTATIDQWLTILNPQLWSTRTPNLYTLETTVKSAGQKPDVYTTTFGVRTIKFDADSGFYLNGERMKMQGVCLHHDSGAMGVAVPDRSYERRLEILKEYGVNALRMSHNQPSAEFLDMCDRMGFVVIDEAFDKWKTGGNYYNRYFDQWWASDLANMLMRDRNHPSVVLWSIGNELQEAWDDTNDGVERAAMLQDFVHQMEPTRPVILSAQNRHQDKFSGVTDVIGYNYLEARAMTDHKRHPERIFIVTEELPYYSGEEGNIRSYTPINPWNYVEDNDFFCGGFIWPGVDYLGEAGWPSKGWPAGLFDVCMNEKPRAAYHRAKWNKTPMVRIAVKDNGQDIDNGRDLWQWPRLAGHWNFPDSYLGMVMEVVTTTNCEEVELVQDGNVMGRQRTADFPNNTIVWNIPYKHGTLRAKGFNCGEQVAEYEIQTAGKPMNLTAVVDREAIKADGQDLAHVKLLLVDENGVTVPVDDRLLKVKVNGAARLLALDSGDLRQEGSYARDSIMTYFGHALATIQSTREPGEIEVELIADGLPPVKIQITSYK